MTDRQELIEETEDIMKPYHEKRCTACSGAGRFMFGRFLFILPVRGKCMYCEGSGRKDSSYWYAKSLGVEVVWE